LVHGVDKPFRFSMAGMAWIVQMLRHRELRDVPARFLGNLG
jgi:hypothetical protein